MTILQKLWQAVIDHAVLLLVFVPAIGGLLARLIGPSSTEGARSIARANVWASLLLMSLIITHFQTSQESLPPAWQFETSVRWVSLPMTPINRSTSKTPLVAPVVDARPQVRLAFGLDGVALPFTALLVALTFAVVYQISATGTATDESVSSSSMALTRSTSPTVAQHLRLSDVLLMQAALLSVLTATDAVCLGACLLVATGITFQSLVRTGTASSRLAGAKFLRSQLISSMMLMVGVIGLAIANWWMSIRATGTPTLTFDLTEIVRQLPAAGTSTAQDYWELTGPWLFLLIVGGCVLRVPIPPFHAWWPSVVEEADRTTIALLIVGWIPSGLVIGLRSLSTVFLMEREQLSPRVLLWCNIAAACMALASLANQKQQRRFALWFLSASVLAFGALWIGTREAMEGAVLLMSGVCGASAVCWLTSFRSRTARWLFVGATWAGAWRVLAQSQLIASDILWIVAVIALAISFATWPADDDDGKEDTQTRQLRGAWRLLPLAILLGQICFRPQVLIDAMRPALTVLENV